MEFTDSGVPKMFSSTHTPSMPSVNMGDVVHKLENTRDMVNSKVYKSATRKMILFGCVIVSILLYGSVIIYFYHIAETQRQVENIDFVHKVVWGQAGTDGALLVASKFAANLLTLVIGLLVFKTLMTEGELAMRKFVDKKTEYLL